MRRRRWSAVLAVVVAGGAAVGGILGLPAGTAAALSSTSGVTVAGGNGAGTAANQLDFPGDVWVDGSGNVYVADTQNSRVQEWAPGATAGVTVAGGNGAGSASNQLNGPLGVFVDGSGNVYVADSFNNRVQEWAPGATAGVTVAGGNVAGSAANELNLPQGLFVDGSGNVYVADSGNNRVQKWAPGATAGVTVAGGNGAGSAANQLSNPFDVFVDSSGNVYVADGFVTKWAPGATVGVTVAGGINATACNSAIDEAVGVFVNGAGIIYVADAALSEVIECAPGAPGGVVVAGSLSAGSAANELQSPGGLFVDGAGNIYIADSWNSRVQEWGPSPNVAPSITTEPQSQSVFGTQTAKFSAYASGNPPATQQWEQSTDGGSTWSDIPGATNSTYSVTNAPLSDNGLEFRAVFANNLGSVTTTAATLTVNPPILAVTSQPSNETAVETTTVNFLAGVRAGPPPFVLWQQSTDGGSTWSDIGVPAVDQGCSDTLADPTLYTCAYTIANVPLSDSGFEFRAVFTNVVGTVTTNAATLTVTPPPPPTTSVVLPANGATVSGTIWTDSSSGSPVGIASVSFEVSGGSVSDKVVGSGTLWAYGYLGVWDTHDVPNGIYSIQSVATDTFGNTNTSAPSIVTVDNPPLHTAVVLPANGATVSGASYLDASALGTSDVTGVQFELSGGSLSAHVIVSATPTLVGWLVKWDTTSVPNGTYTLQSVATEVGGTTATSPGITITVSN